MKSPPRQFTDDVARHLVEEFIEVTSAKKGRVKKTAGAARKTRSAKGKKARTR
jgi:hypothetical protein